MKPNIIGIVGAVIAFISLALPWWTITLRESINSMGYNGPLEVSIYPYQIAASANGTSVTFSINLWYGWTAFVLLIIGGLLGIAGSLAQNTKAILFAGGVLTVLSTVIFALGLQSELSKSVLMPGYPAVGLFSSGSGFLGYISYTTYLSFGFWLALVGAIIMLIASRRKIEVSAHMPLPSAPMRRKLSPSPHHEKNTCTVARTILFHKSRCYMCEVFDVIEKLKF